MSDIILKIPQRKRVLIGGAGGFIGTALAEKFAEDGWDVFKLSRKYDDNSVFWDPENDLLNPCDIEGFDAIISLGGENIFGFWTETKKNAILKSRIKSAGLLAGTIAMLKSKPNVFVCASAVGYYGPRPRVICDEKSDRGDGFLAYVCQQWENACSAAKKSGVRTVSARFGTVIDASGGAFKKMLDGFSHKIAFQLGGGKRKIPWISLNDLVSAILFICKNESISGVVNVCAPKPVENAELSKIAAQRANSLFTVPVPSVLLKLALGQMADELLLADANVLPQKLLSAKFPYANPTPEFLKQRS